MKFKRLVASFLMGATLVSGVSMPLILADTNTYASTFSSIDYATASVNMDGIKAFVTRMYKVCLDRAPEEDGLNGWAQKLANKEATGCSVAYGFVFSPEFIGKNPTNEAYVNYMYDAFFGREADSDGFKYWVDLLNNGASKEFVFCGFANSQEFSNLCNNYGVVRGFHIEGEDFNRIALINLFVERLYNVVLNRTCDEVGMPGWTVKLNNHEESGCSVAYGFVFSPEFLNKHTCNDCYVEILYNAFLGRSSDTSGKSSWVSMLNEGKSRELVFNGFAGSPEFAGICSEYGIEPGSLSTEGTTHAEGTCTICGNTNSNGSSNGGATNNGGLSTGNGGSSTGSGNSNNGSTNNGNNGSTPTSTSTPTPYPTLTPPSKYKEFLEPGVTFIYDYDEYDKHPDNYVGYGCYLNEEGYLVTGWVNIDKEDKIKAVDLENNEILESHEIDVYYMTSFIDEDDGTVTMYFDPETGVPAIGLSEIDGTTYLFYVPFLAKGNRMSVTDFINGGSYFVDEKGIVQTSGWQTDVWGNKYYVDSSTYKLVTGWQEIDGNKYYFNYRSEMETGVEGIDSKYYLFNDDGILQTEPGWHDEYYVGSDGALYTGWQEIDGNKYYFNYRGEMETGVEKIHFDYYLFNNDGILQTEPGWHTFNSKKYYLNNEGTLCRGFQTIDGKKYYFNESNCYLIKGLMNIGDKTYYSDSNGVIQTGWETIGSKKYYFLEDGAAATGWNKLDNKWYYFNEDGTMRTNDFAEDNGQKYYLGDDGVMVTDKWVEYKDKWYHLSSSGAMEKSKWIEYKDENCYLKDSGAMASSEWIKWNNNWYYFDDKGYMVTGWKDFTKSNGTVNWYYFNPSSGKMVTGAQTINGAKYYFYPDGSSVGVMATNVTINGITYGSNGKGQ
ncbi:MAG: DUF4214 domain-containing protein [Clostridia bacterium]|nr:DUF4214 domain-containing protein [Clostridia bacterium]